MLDFIHVVHETNMSVGGFLPSLLTVLIIYISVKDSANFQHFSQIDKSDIISHS